MSQPAIPPPNRTPSPLAAATDAVNRLMGAEPLNTSRYRHLEAAMVTETALRLAERVKRQFPGSGLSGVARELAIMAGETGERVELLNKPHWPLRVAVWIVVLIVVLLAFAMPISIRFAAEDTSMWDLLQGVEAAINNIVFAAIAIYFLVTVEVRPKRRRALDALHQLRSVAHIVDMHQLAKDPSHAAPGNSPPRTMLPGEPRALNAIELAAYLDLCSELLAIVSKLAALYAHHLNDSVVLAAVNEVEQLSYALSKMIWEKINILDKAHFRTHGVHIAGSPQQ